MFTKKKKFYKEVKCLACNGTGRQDRPWGTLQGNQDIVAILSQGICVACNGRGTQTVLEREE